MATSSKLPKFLCLFCSKAHKVCHSTCDTAVMHISNEEFTVSSFKELFDGYRVVYLVAVFSRAIQVGVKLNLCNSDIVGLLIIIKNIFKWQLSSWQDDPTAGPYSKYVACPDVLEGIGLDLPDDFPDLDKIAELYVVNFDLEPDVGEFDVLESSVNPSRKTTETVKRNYSSEFHKKYVEGKPSGQVVAVMNSIIWEMQCWVKFPLTGPMSHLKELCVQNGVKIIVDVLKDDPLEMKVLQLVDNQYVDQNLLRFVLGDGLNQLLYLGCGGYILPVKDTVDPGRAGIDLGSLFAILQEVRNCIVRVNKKIADIDGLKNYLENTMDESLDESQLHSSLQELKEDLLNVGAVVKKIEDMFAPFHKN